MNEEQELLRLYGLYQKSGDNRGQLEVLKRLDSIRSAAQQPAKPSFDFSSKSTEELTQLVDSGRLQGESRAAAIDEVSRRELQPEGVTPQRVQEWGQRKGQEFYGAAKGGLELGLKTFGAGVGQAVRQGARGVELALGADVFGANPQEYTQQKQAQLGAEEEALRAKYPKQSESGMIGVSKAVGEALPLAGAGGAAKTVAQATMQGLKIGLATGGTKFGETGELSERAKSAGIGAATGAAASFVLGKIAGAIGKQDPADEAQAVHDFAKSQGVDLAFTDTTKSMFARRVDQALEKMGILGTAGFRRKQQGQLLSAAENYLERLRPTKDAPTLIQESINKTATTFQQRAGVVFEDVFQRADNIGGNVDLLNTRNLAKELIEKEVKKAQLGNPAFVSELQKIAQGGSFDMRTAHAIRSDMLDAARAARGDNLTATKESRAYEQIAKAMDYDLGRYAINNGLYKSWRRANNYFKEKVVPMRDAMITKAGTTDMPDEILAKFIRTDGVSGKDRALKLYNAMDSAGRDSAKYLLVERAFEKSVKDLEVGRSISPAKFASELERLQKTTGIFFKGADKAELDGFTRMMKAAYRAGAFTAMPENGASMFFPSAVAGLATQSPATSSAIAGSALTAKLLFTTEAGKRLLMSSAKVDYNSPQMQALIKGAIALSQQTDSEVK